MSAEVPGRARAPGVPARARAVLLSAPGIVEVTDVAVRPPGPDEVLIQVVAAGICGSDVELFAGNRPPEIVRYPVIPGHEWSGRIVAVGADNSGFTPGDPVVAEGLRWCGTCARCREGSTNLCLTGYRETGFTEPGAFAEYVTVPTRLVHRLPDDRPLEHAALLEPTACVVAGLTAAGFTTARPPASRSPTAGSPAAGLSADGLPANGLSAGQSSAARSPADGLPADGLPASPTSAAGSPAADSPAGGSSAAGLSAAGLSAAGLPTVGSPAGKLPASQSPTAGSSAAGSSAGGSSAGRLSAAGLPASPSSATGPPAADSPAGGSSAGGSPTSGLPTGTLRSGQRIVVLGGGTLGLIAVQLLALTSPTELILVEGQADRRELGARFGATATIEPAELADAKLDADLVIEAAGASDTGLAAIRAARRGGTVVLLGIAGAGATPLPPDELALRELHVHGVFGARADCWPIAIDHFAAGELDFGAMISHRFPLDEVREAVQTASSRAAGRGKVLLRPTPN